MKYYRCKCGSKTAYGSMPPYPCNGCIDCGTTLEMFPECLRTPEPHDFVQDMIDTDDGPHPKSYCRWCHRTKKQLEF